MNKQAFFLGCVIPLRFPGIEVAARRVFGQLGIECADLDGYSCCPEPVVLGLTDRDMALAVSARNLALAERAGADLVVLCNGCYETLAEADHALRHDAPTTARVGDLPAGIGTRYDGTIRIKHFIEFLHDDVGLDRIAKAISRPVDISLALHYGCHLFRETTHPDTWRKPRMMKGLVEAMGARCVDYGLEQLCCGFPISQFDKDAALKERLLPKLKALSATNETAAARSSAAPKTCPVTGGTKTRTFFTHCRARTAPRRSRRPGVRPGKTADTGVPAPSTSSRRRAPPPARTALRALRKTGRSARRSPA